MVQATFSPAVATGLHFAMAAGLPREAHATLADAVGTYALVLASTDFLMGLAAGAAACGVVAIAVAAIASHHTRVKNEEQELAVALKTLEHTSTQSALAADTSSEDSTATLSAGGASVAPASATATTAARTTPAKATMATVDHRQAQTSEHTPRKKGAASHFASAGERKTRRASDVPVIPRGAAAHASASAKPDAPKPETRAAQATKAPARHTATDYGDIAQNYVSRLSRRDRMSIRARGVQAMLAERLGVDMFKDVPVIQRADGTVGDVGTGWWDAKLGESIKRDFSGLPEVDDIDMTGVRNVLVARNEAQRAQAATVPQASRTNVANTTPALARRTPEKYVSRVAHLGLSAADRSVFIANHVAQIDDIAFPEVHREGAGEADLWAQAMDALDARSNDPAALAGMEVAAEDPLHLPDTPTEVLPFRPVAGHPEVVDKETYVDYLLRQEIERNSSDAVRRHGRNYLRLLDGGSTSSAPTLYNIRTNRVETVENKPRHMAPVRNYDDLPLAVGA